MLVRLQNPGCTFFATEKDWREKHRRCLVEDARPMLILAPMHPVLLVYDLDQTDGPPLPMKLLEFARFEGQWRPRWLSNLVANANRHRIKVDFKKLSKTLGGFATFLGSGSWRKRIVIHAGLDQPSRFGVLAHELGHILLGHTGGDEDHWWPSRMGLSTSAIEVEAEAVAHIVAARFGLRGGSAAYLSGYVKNGAVPAAVSLDHIAKVAGRIEQMAQGLLPPPRTRPRTRPARRSARA
ncbi:MAG: ImmA/IrrE family metallo-endopeptidase [Alphaproteobacteria bacterium]|nr:ImmA/IrrE family metallo-endopeptidase [Alphaproteobacteria bacterium]